MKTKITIKPDIFTVRMLTIGLFIFSPFIAAFISLYRAIRNSDYYFCAFVICLFAGLYGYTFNLHADMILDADLVRIYNMYERLATMNFIQAQEYMFYAGDLSYFYFWILARIGIPAHFLGFMASATLYGSAFFIVKKTTEFFNKDHYTNYLVLGALLIIFSIHPLFFSGIRSATAISLLVLAIVNFIDNKRKTSIWLCLLSASIHYAMLPFVVLFFVNFYASKRTIDLFYWWIFAMWILYYPIFYSLDWLLKNFTSDFAVVLSAKIDFYVFSWDSKGQLSGLSTGSRFFTIQRFLLILVTVYYVLMKSAKKTAQSNPMFNYLRQLTILYLLTLLFFSYNLVALGRYLEIGIFLCPVYLISYGILNPSRKYNYIIFSLLGTIIFLAVIAIVRESFSGQSINIVYENVPSLLFRSLFYLLNIHS